MKSKYIQFENLGGKVVVLMQEACRMPNQKEEQRVSAYLITDKTLSAFTPL